MAALAGQARAEPITFTFAGYVHDLDGLQDWTGTLAADLATLGVTVNATVSGTITFDSATVGSGPCDGRGCWYTLSAFDIRIGLLRGSFSGPTLAVLQQPFPDASWSYLLWPPSNIGSPPPLDGTMYSKYGFYFQLFSGTGLSTDALPIVPPAVDSATFGSSQYSFLRFASTSDGLSHDVTFVIESIEANRAPVIGPVSPLWVYEGDLADAYVTASDPDGDPVILGATDLPAGARFDPETGHFTWNTNSGDAGTHVVLFTATDGSIDSGAQMQITVFPSASGSQVKLAKKTSEVKVATKDPALATLVAEFTRSDLKENYSVSVTLLGNEGPEVATVTVTT